MARLLSSAIPQCELASAGLGAPPHVRFSRVTTMLLAASSPAVLRVLQIAVEQHEWRRSGDLATRERTFAFTPSGSPARQDRAASAMQGADGGTA
jgi:hypothetical protein